MPAVTMAQYHTQVNDRAELAAGKETGRKPFSSGAAVSERLSLVIAILSNPRLHLPQRSRLAAFIR